MNVLLHRHTGQEDIIVGSPIAGRDHPDLVDQIGFYVNTLALRNRVAGSMSFEEHMAGVRNVTLEAYDHRMYPFDRLVDELSLSRDTSRSALFDVMVVFQDQNPRSWRLGDLEVAPAEVDFPVAKFDLTLSRSL